MLAKIQGNYQKDVNIEQCTCMCMYNYVIYTLLFIVIIRGCFMAQIVLLHALDSRAACTHTFMPT